MSNLVIEKNPRKEKSSKVNYVNVATSSSNIATRRGRMNKYYRVWMHEKKKEKNMDGSQRQEHKNKGNSTIKIK